MENMIDGDIPWEEKTQIFCWLEIFFCETEREENTFFPVWAPERAAFFFFKTLGHHTRFPLSIDQSIDAEYIICTLYYLT